MRLLSWNCRGAGRPLTVRAIKAFTRKEGPDVLFMVETKIKASKVDCLRLVMGFNSSFCVDSIGSAGGLTFFWSLRVDIEVVYSNNNCIAALVYSNPLESLWLLIGVYGPPYLAMRRKFWRLMEDIIEGFSEQWLMIGDLNSISSPSDKRGGSSSSWGSSKFFKTFVNNVGAIDLGFNGPWFTWSNRRIGLANIRERLDRGLCNVDWQSMFPKANVRHPTTPNSDHNPILLDTHLETHGGSRPFRFVTMWVKNGSSVDVVQGAWDIPVEGLQDFKFVKKCHRTKKDLISWNRSIFGFAKSRIRAIEDKLKLVQELEPTQEKLAIEATLSLELNDWLEREEIKWKQKSRELWLKEGDKNSKFFHLSTMIRHRRNFIAKIKLPNNQWIQARADIENYFSSQFRELFQSSQLTITSELDELFSPCISEAENNDLSRVSDFQEVGYVIWSMHPLKASGLVGLPSLFFKHYWPIVGDQIVAAVQSFFRFGSLLPQMNHTFITLIPKRIRACNFNQFRPISLCNFYYKIISKILVNRLRPLFPIIIEPTQTAFVPGRWITENVVLAQEIMHCFSQSKRKKRKCWFQT